MPIINVWQEDKGFRLAMSRNKSVAASHYEYIIEIDGDLILYRKYVEDRLSFARKKCFLKGGRVNLNNALTEKLCRSGRLSLIHFYTGGLRRRINATVRT